MTHKCERSEYYKNKITKIFEVQQSVSVMLVSLVN